MTEFSLDHVLRMTNDRGIFEHCLFATPDVTEGYTVDDNARALQMVLRLDQAEKRKKDLVEIYLKFLIGARSQEGFHNDLGFDLAWEDKAGTGEWFGRAMAALGETAISGSDEQRLVGVFVFDQMVPLLPQVRFLRPKAHLIFGLAQRIEFEKTDSELRGFLAERNKLAEEKGKAVVPPVDFLSEVARLADEVVEAYRFQSGKSWRWYEKAITYDNGRLPMGLFWAYQAIGKKVYLEIAEESLNFLIEKTYDSKKDCFSFPGYRGWLPKEGKKALWGQQPVEAGSLVEAGALAYRVTKKKGYLDAAVKALEWYTGRNVLGVSLLDPVTKGVRDGLEVWGVNPNQGSESILSYLLAHLAFQEVK